MKTLLSFVSLLIIAATAWAERPTGLSPEAQDALDVLLRAESFCDGPIGIVGSTPDTLKAFRLLAKDPQAGAVFKHLVAKGSASGQLYALCGLYFTDDDYFQKAAAALRRSATAVEFHSGCFGCRMPVAAIVESKSPDAMRLKGPKDSMDRWLDDHAKQENVVLDMVGGGYPNALRRLRQ
ncbi:MAG TPA: hypothetical protein VGO11_27930 [Chthoniobacteraceae bacterium]|jgi:hypothetical protein|nr:hypothetical protein [Chthoniobacteraceae bacterium]